jgi:hypothetical protein
MSDTPKNIGKCLGRSVCNVTVNGERKERFYYLEEMKGKEREGSGRKGEGWLSFECQYQ